MTSTRKRNPNKVLGCSLLRTGSEEPLTMISGILRRSGVRIGKVDRKTRLISGRIGSIFDGHSCKVTVRVYSQKDVSLVELVCEGAWGRPGPRALSGFVDVLRSNFDDISLADVSQTTPWVPNERESKNGRRIRTEALHLLNSMEAEIG